MLLKQHSGYDEACMQTLLNPALFSCDYFTKQQIRIGNIDTPKTGTD